MPVKELIEVIHEKKKLVTSKNYLKRTIYWGKRLFRIFSNRVYIIGCPTHTNIGDNAILIAEKEFLKRCGIDSDEIECITESEFIRDYKIIKQWINRKSLLCGHGGGNMGNVYYSEEKIRRIMIQEFPENPMIVFPQTIHYEGENKIEEESNSINIYNARKNLTLIAREQTSKEIMEKLYPDTQILLTPDIVFSTKMEDYGVVPQERTDILFCIRNDIEKNIDDNLWNELKTYVKSFNLEYRNTDMHSNCEITEDNREKCVCQKMQEFCSAKVAVTDRLHGMIFAALTGTPCIVFSNNNHKVKGTYEWISCLPYIRYVETVEEAKRVMPELLAMERCKYDNYQLIPLYDQIMELIRKGREG